MIDVNEYFEGNVKSLGFSLDNEKSSVGVMAIGSYTFGTAAPEKMTVVKGALAIKRSDDTDWVTFSSGEAFDVIGDSSFDVKVSTPTAYLCEYL
ncbi:pyrimidine/purine nucleoside phosphorylase [Vibrio sp. ZSDE26]|uniref:Pyrimidine/purine nucleoside phosphorylase n=1 Tax=Vibrio amylolyticus TaxID=2847292 RepID=A0A9X2BIW4_9VIBR|nr:pyrimidine/purine nucleoside phosphorylase [Vibrio amylolyticus]MCK6264545.1 pyrimidine/purine nucleoside phosphorylase [Vibrio amylolyticus]